MFVRAYKYDELRALAESFLKRFHPSGQIPVPIEEIVELKLKISVVPVPGLMQHKVDAFTWKDLKTIVVDSFCFERSVRRYRFTLAHEVCHILLHRDVIQRCPSTTIEAHKAYVESIGDKQHSIMEANADCMAGLILVPAVPLAAKFEEAKRLGLDNGIAQDNPALRGYMADWISDAFEVSADVVDYRLCYDGRWPFKKRRRTD